MLKYSYPLVSVIIPSFNNEEKIKNALQSVSAQDYENIEIIFVNDASTDKTLSNAEKFLKNSKRGFKIINHEKNLGVSAARNSGIEASQGEYILFCDGDDMMKKNLVSELAGLIKKYDCEISFGGITEHFENGGADREIPIDLKISQPLNGEQAAYMRIFTKGFMPHICCTMFRKNFLEKINLRFTEGCTNAEDTEFQTKAFCRAEKISFTRECLYIYFNAGSKKDSIEKNMKIFRSCLEADSRTAEYLIEHLKSKKIKFLVKNSYLPELAVKRLTGCAKFNEPQKYFELLKNPEFKKILRSSFKTFFFKPEVCLKAFAVLFMPKLYFKIRKTSPPYDKIH